MAKATFKEATHEGIVVCVGKKEYKFLYAHFPWFKYCTIEELENVVFVGGDFFWEDADIALHGDSLDHPEAYPQSQSLELWFETIDLMRKERRSAA